METLRAFAVIFNTCLYSGSFLLRFLGTQSILAEYWEGEGPSGFALGSSMSCDFSSLPLQLWCLLWMLWIHAVTSFCQSQRPTAWSTISFLWILTTAVWKHLWTPRITSTFLKPSLSDWAGNSAAHEGQQSCEGHVSHGLVSEPRVLGTN